MNSNLIGETVSNEKDSEELSDMIVEAETAIENYRAHDAEKLLDSIIDSMEDNYKKRLIYVKNLIDNLSYDEALVDFQSIMKEAGMEE